MKKIDNITELGIASIISVILTTQKLSNQIVKTSLGLILSVLERKSDGVRPFVGESTEPLKTGVYVVHDHRNRIRLGLVISFVTLFKNEEQCHEIIVMEDGYITTWLVWESDKGVKWNVCDK